MIQATRDFTVKTVQKAGDMALNGSRIRDTARVLGISTDAALSELKKKHRP